MGNKFWIRGNTHCHTNRSDGNASPEEAARIYRDHGYNFLCISDHDQITDPAELAGLETENFIFIKSAEVGNQATDRADRPVHVCAMGAEVCPAPIREGRIKDVVEGSVARVIECGATPIVAHPNFGYAFDHKVMRQINTFNLFEIWNSSTSCYNEGNAARISCEQMWDILLSEGREDLYAVASDDAHNYSGYKTQNMDFPGGGWVGVRVSKLSQDEIISSLLRGDFYASTGVELVDLNFDGQTLSVEAKPEDGLSYFVRFIGLHGQILQDVDGHKASYTITGAPAEAYVRAKVIASNDDVAWTQPVRK